MRNFLATTCLSFMWDIVLAVGVVKGATFFAGMKDYKRVGSRHSVYGRVGGHGSRCYTRFAQGRPCTPCACFPALAAAAEIFTIHVKCCIYHLPRPWRLFLPLGRSRFPSCICTRTHTLVSVLTRTRTRTNTHSHINTRLLTRTHTRTVILTRPRLPAQTCP